MLYISRKPCFAEESNTEYALAGGAVVPVLLLSVGADDEGAADEGAGSVDVADGEEVEELGAIPVGGAKAVGLPSVVMELIPEVPLVVVLAVEDGLPGEVGAPAAAVGSMEDSGDVPVG
jgi:hypothetical protein